jgi:hypothetical protein
LNLIIEVTGEQKKDKAAKVATARTLWVPAINNHGEFGRWDSIEISDPLKSAIRGMRRIRFGHACGTKRWTVFTRFLDRNARRPKCVNGHQN